MGRSGSERGKGRNDIPYDYYAPNIKMPKFHMKHGDFDTGEISRYFLDNTKVIYGDTLRHYKALADVK